MDSQGEGNRVVPAIGLPKGGGAIHGLGEKLTTGGVFGTAAFSVPIAASPGRGGFGPLLALAYDSGSGNTPFGLGWTVAVPSIRRATHQAVPRYEDDVDVFSLGGEDLVPVGDAPGVELDGARYAIRRYRPRVDGAFARIERWTRAGGDTHWRTISGDNVTAIFGPTPASRIAEPAGRRVFEWLCERTYDDRGNAIVYHYRREDGAGVAPSLHERNRGAHVQQYLERVCYGGSHPYLAQRAGFDRAAWERANRWHFELVFEYGDRPDPFSTYRAGFEIRTHRLCRRIVARHRFDELGPEPIAVRSTILRHEPDRVATRLVEVIHASHEPGQPDAELPGIRFRYTEARIADELRELAGDALPGPSRAQWVDLDGDGLPGLLARDQAAWSYRRNLGGTFAPPVRVAAVPSVGGGQLVDVDGDGRVDYVCWARGSFALEAAARWQPFARVPNVAEDDPQARFIDLTGDGLPDLLVTEDDCLCWYPSEGRAGYGAAQRIAKALDEERGPAIVLASATETIFLADMSGDGLTDLVRIRNGELCYWPNTGHGTFGPKVAMDDAPWFAGPDAFDPRRLRLGDVDGSGTTDVIYLGAHEVRWWRNESGNRWSAPHTIGSFPRVDDLASVQLLDLLGSGTACLVWTSELPADAGARVRYVPLMADGKPCLLAEIDNGLGAITRLGYAPSTKFYLADERAGRPWITKLPFPVHVVERVETIDAIARTRFVARAAYHHGYFDRTERELRGFGMVEQWDTELFGDRGDPDYRNLDEASHVPPVLTRTWYHTGWYEDGASIEERYAAEYYAGDAEAWPLAPASLPGELTATEQRDACRALKGRVLRREVYGLDGGEREPHPYSVVATVYAVRAEAPRVFHVHDRETLAYHYERDPADPRIGHTVVLDVDRLGVARRTVAIAYPRRRGTIPEQMQLVATCAERDPIHLDGDPVGYRIALPFEERSYELLGLAAAAPWRLDDLRAAAAAASRRLLARTRVRYYRDALDEPLPFGVATPLAIRYEHNSLALTPEVLAQPALGGRITAALLRDGGYRDDVGEPGTWWIPSGVPLFEPTARDAFYLPTGVRDPFGASSRVVYDSAGLFPVRSLDPFDNTTLAEYDYRVLAARAVTDPNGNRTEVVFDTRGMVIATAVLGKGDDTGDRITGFTRSSASIPEILADPARHLQQATTSFHYDVDAWRRAGAPAAALAIARCRHVIDEPAPAGDDVQLTLVYSDGAGRALLTKQRAEEGRWVGNGATVYDNKGNAVRTYEPFFDGGPDYTDDDALVRIGVSPTVHYDPLGRVIRTVMPDGSYSRVVFDAWHLAAYDLNDTVRSSAWYARATGASESERAAAAKAAEHDDTPLRAYVDVLGRRFASVAHGRRRVWDTADTFHVVDEYIPARTELDVEGRPLAIHDGRRCEGLTLEQAIGHRGNPVATYTYALAGLELHADVMDGGPRWSLPDATGKPLHAWDSRGHHTRVSYDAARRPTRVEVERPDGGRFITQRIVYGEALDPAEARRRNLRGRAWLVFDGAGVVETEACDGEGRVVASSRRLVDLRALPGWPVVDALAPDWSELPADLATAPQLERIAFATRSRFDALGRLVELTSPDGSVHEPAYNRAGLLERVAVRVRGAAVATPFVDAIEYDARGNRTAVRYANGVATTYERHPLTTRLAHLVTTRGTTVLQDLRYTHDAIGNVTEVRDDAIEPVYFRNEEVEARGEYTYDALYRLIEARGRESATRAGVPDHAEPPRGTAIPAHDRALRNYRQLYDYDPAGNLLAMRHLAGGTGWARALAYDERTNRLAATDALAAYPHDSAGNLLAMPHLARLDWDHTDHLARVAIAPGDTALFAYDGARQRVRKVRIKDGTVTERIYLGACELVRSYRAGAPVEELSSLHVMDGTARVCLVETPAGGASRFRFQLDNHLGSSSIELDERGEVISYEEYHPYGTTAYHAVDGATIEVSAKRYRYTGMERDEETGLAYHSARYYAPWLGRWCSADPSGLKGGPNLFAFANANPIVFKDITGRSPVIVAIVVIALLATVAYAAFSPPYAHAPAHPLTPEEIRRSDRRTADSYSIMVTTCVAGGLAPQSILLAGGVGAVTELGGQAMSDALVGEVSSPETYATRAVVGFVTGAGAAVISLGARALFGQVSAAIARGEMPSIGRLAASSRTGNLLWQEARAALTVAREAFEAATPEMRAALRTQWIQARAQFQNVRNAYVAIRNALRSTRQAAANDATTVVADTAATEVAGTTADVGSGLARTEGEVTGMLSPQEMARQWNPKLKANSYSSTAVQYLYAIYDDAGRLLKYGTTRSLGPPGRVWNGRYTAAEFATFGQGAEMEILNSGTARVIREAERRLITTYESIWGKLPPRNPVHH